MRDDAAHVFKAGSVKVTEAFGTGIVAARYGNDIKLDLSSNTGHSIPSNINHERFV